MIAIDSSALIAILTMEPDAPRLLRALSNARGRVLSAMSLLETSLVFAGRTTGAEKGGAGVWRPLDALLAEAKVELVPFDAEQTAIARAAFLKYGKGRHAAGLNFGDCASYALAKAKKVPLLYKGEDFARTDIASAL